jgi:folate-binding protein YgfZ
VAWHFGDPLGEQRRLLSGLGFVDVSNRGVVAVRGPARLGWLNDITAQKVDQLAPQSSALNLILSPHGHVEFELHQIDDGETSWLIVEGFQTKALIDYLESMKFMTEVEIADVSNRFAVIWEPKSDLDESGLPTWLIPSFFATGRMSGTGESKGGDPARYVPERPAFLVGREVIVPREQIHQRMNELGAPAGVWALEALRVHAGVPRIGFETDHRTLPHEVGWLGAGVHLEKGCYRGQEAVARVHNLGKPPRALVLLHLDGMDEELPQHAASVVIDGEEVGWVATPARHFEQGPIATAIVKSKYVRASSARVGDTKAEIQPVVVVN